MYLKKIRMKGFKSFAKDVELEFDKGISAIVGPNGSGKSNIVDAVRWVLGEQSTKMLRSKKMEDVIFAGTENKAPLSYAEVSITLDTENADDDDAVVVSRRLFRTGESEYRLNNKTCKLKDIHGLFNDTGLGKNGYSLINQGEIENITNSGPSELRRIVEEAVGIVGYKTSKQEAERKLESAQNNMDRLQDILDELEKRLKPLKRQSEKAREYIGIFDELKALDLYFFKQKMEEATIQKARYETELFETEKSIFDINTKLRSLDLKYQEKKNAIRKCDEERESLKTALNQCVDDLTKANSDVLVGEERRRHLEERAQRLSEEQKKILSEYEKCEDEINEFNAQLIELSHALALIDSELKGLEEEKKGIGDRIKAFEILETQALSEQQERKGLKEQTLREIQDLQKEIGALETRRKITTDSEALIAQQRAEINEKRGSAEEYLIASETQLQAYRERQNELESQGRILNERAEKLMQKLNLLNNNLSVNQSKIAYLKKVEAGYSDYLPGIQLIMRQAGFAASDVYGPVGELLTVDAKYVTAIDVALGRKTQNIVVRDLKTAHQCINLLKSKKAGRATFLPIDNLKQYSISANESAMIRRLKGKGLVDIASELISCQDRFRGVAEHLLSRTIVAEDFKAAENIQRSLKNFTIVTLEGELFYSGGAVVGGSLKNAQHSPMLKKIEITELEKENKNYQSQIDVASGELEKVKTEQMNRQKNMNTLRSDTEAVSEAIWQIRSQLQQLDQQLKALNDDHAGGEKTAESTETALNTAMQTLAQKQALLAAFEEETADINEDERKGLTEALSSVEAKIVEIQIKRVQQDSNKNNIDQRFAILVSRRDEKQKEIDRVASEIIANAENIESTIAFIEKSRLDGQNADQLQKTLKSRISALDENKLNWTADTEGLDFEIRDLNHELILQTETQNDFEVEKQKIISKCHYLEESIYNRYALNTIMAYDALKAIDMTRVELTEERQKTLRSKLLSLGQVNMEAIEEYTEVKERYDFLFAQMEDMNKAKKELRGIIADLYHSMEQQFTEGFEKLQHIFSDVFAVLFEGGHAEIRYSDPENKMESGIELSAQPPGKNLKHLALLSGGEKSMTAIALLFSFLQLNPTPFCVIDEIDAALDDQNIARYTRFMNSIAENNQFILITHRKKTLEVCDTIYGVTMSVSGVSKLLSMRLSDYTEQLNN